MPTYLYHSKKTSLVKGFLENQILSVGDSLLSPWKSIIGSTRLNFSVRNGKRCGPCDKSPTLKIWSNDYNWNPGNKWVRSKASDPKLVHGEIVRSPIKNTWTLFLKILPQGFRRSIFLTTMDINICILNNTVRDLNFFG